MPCKHPGKPHFAYDFVGENIRWIAWCRGCGEEWGGESPDPIAIVGEWVVE